MRIKFISLFFIVLALGACSSKQEQQQVKNETKQTATDIGHNTRDAAKSTGHFFRDLFKGD
ncbi:MULTISPECIES: hypothetical protein [Vibrio]|uniref:Lipoprotein n=1 Tax=Vibrio algicola TaxID=2662262 RepID=A0A5Q0TDI9_9VIBR|nr:MULTISPECIES: hypothetical protein [Vibrio]MBD1575820.1 hypothetical protein [Vibrio sp. S11_S32]